MNSFDAKFFNKSLWKPKTNIKAVKPITPHFAKPATKGASLAMQKQWKSFSFPTKQAMRMKYPDSDGDGVPNRWDCQPNNFWKQDKGQDKSFNESLDRHITGNWGEDSYIESDEERKEKEIDSKQLEFEEQEQTKAMERTQKDKKYKKWQDEQIEKEFRNERFNPSY